MSDAQGAGASLSLKGVRGPCEQQSQARAEVQLPGGAYRALTTEELIRGNLRKEKILKSFPLVEH